LILYSARPPVAKSSNPPVFAFEVLVVPIDGLVIKLLVTLDAFPGDNYRGISWPRSMHISGIGNALSYIIGHIATQNPWRVHWRGACT
jgi:hypothetical protein